MHPLIESITAQVTAKHSLFKLSHPIYFYYRLIIQCFSADCNSLKIKITLRLKAAMPKSRHSGILLVYIITYTLKRNRTTSPSCITYSLPSERISPFSRAAVMVPHASRSVNAMTSARIKPRSKSV